jgi:hypothetical protein
MHPRRVNASALLGTLRTGNLVYGILLFRPKYRNLLFAAIAAAPKRKPTPRQPSRYSGPDIRDSPLCLSDASATFFLAGTFFAASARFRS